MTWLKRLLDAAHRQGTAKPVPPPAPPAPPPPPPKPSVPHATSAEVTAVAAVLRADIDGTGFGGFVNDGELADLAAACCEAAAKARSAAT